MTVIQSRALEDDAIAFDPFKVEGGSLGRTLVGGMQTLLLDRADSDAMTMERIETNIDIAMGRAKKDDHDVVLQATINSLSTNSLTSSLTARFRIYCDSRLDFDNVGEGDQDTTPIAFLAVDLESCDSYVFHNLYFVDRTNATQLNVLTKDHSRSQHHFSGPEPACIFHDVDVRSWVHLWIVPLRFKYFTAEVRQLAQARNIAEVLAKLAMDKNYTVIQEGVLLEHIKYSLHHSRHLGDDTMETVTMDGHGSGGAYADRYR